MTGIRRTAVVSVDHTDGKLICDDSEMVDAFVSPGMAIMSRPTEQTTSHGFQLLDGQRTVVDCVDHTWSSEPGWSPERPADIGRCHNTALFT